MKMNGVAKENARVRSHLVDYDEQRQPTSVLQSVIVLKTHRDSWALQVD